MEKAQRLNGSGLFSIIYENGLRYSLTSLVIVAEFGGENITSFLKYATLVRVFSGCVFSNKVQTWTFFCNSLSMSISVNAISRLWRTRRIPYRNP